MDSRWQHSHWAWSLLTMAVVAGGAASTEASVSSVSLSSHYCPPVTPQASQLGVELILKWVDFAGLCSKGGHMPRGIDVRFGSRNLFRVSSDQPLTWDSGHPCVVDQLASE